MKELASETELMDFSYSLGDWQGVKLLRFNVVIKNISRQPQRYRVHILLDNGKNVGGFIPRKAYKFVEPGETASFVYPVNKMPYYPANVFLRITTTQQ